MPSKKHTDDGDLVLPPDWKMVLTAGEFAVLCGVSQDTVAAWIKAGDISAFRSGEGSRAPWCIPRHQALRDLDRMARNASEARRAGKPANLRSVK